MSKYFQHIAFVFAGLFISNKAYKPLIRFLQVISRFTWELPQTILGLLSALFVSVSGKTSNVFFAYGATVIQCKGRFGGFTLGNFIAGDMEINNNPNQRLFQHEYGHYLQSMKCGPIYLFKYAIPSAISAWRHGFYDHCKHPVEQDANHRAKRFWEQNYQQTFIWDNYHNPIYPEVVPDTIKWYDFVPVYFPVGHLVKALRK